MYCSECNYKITYGVKFCPICGAKTPYFKDEDVNKQQNKLYVYDKQNLDKKTYEHNQYFEQVKSPTYFSNKEIIIGYASNALIFAMVCISIKFAMMLV